MQTLYRFLGITMITIFCSSYGSYSPKPKGKLILNFKHVVGKQLLQLTDTYYTNIHGEKFNVSKFNYYISNIRLKRSNGKTWKQRNSYYLIQSSQPQSQTITLTDIPTGEYTEISFLIGVDEKRNSSGAQEGALDPANGMFWSWNTGYIFLKIEGNTLINKQGTQSSQKFMYHCGGFEGIYNNIRPKHLSLRGNSLKIQANNPSKVGVKVDIQKFFSGAKNVKIHKNPRLMSPARASKVVNNYSQTFSLLR